MQGVTDKTENDVCSDLPTDSPPDNNKSSSQRTLEGEVLGSFERHI